MKKKIDNLSFAYGTTITSPKTLKAKRGVNSWLGIYGMSMSHDSY